MLALIQRVTHASVTVNNNIIGKITDGLLAFIGIEKGDTEKQANRMIERLLGYRIFEDDAGKMNLSLKETGGGLLLVSQFTLAADTQKGMRPSFTPAAPPETAEPLFNYLVEQAKSTHPIVETGQFQAEMKVELLNDGPVTFMLST